MTGEVTETTNVHRTDLFDENTSTTAIDIDLRTKRGRLGARRCRGYQHDRTGKEGVGLDNDTEAPPLLFVANTLGKTEHEDVTPAHADSP